MNPIKPVIPLLLILFIATLLGCRGKKNYNEGYEEGYNRGFVAGTLKGNDEGYQRGIKEGYGNGYSDGFTKKNKDVMALELSLRKSVAWSRKFFTIIFFLINVLALIGLIVYLMAVNGKDNSIKIAKITFLLMSMAIAYLSISAFNINTLVYPQIQGMRKWFIIVAMAPFTFGVSLLIRTLIIKVDVVYSDVLAIFFATFVLTYFIFFLINLDLFLLQNELASYCVISMSAGGLAFAGFTIIDTSHNTVR